MNIEQTELKHIKWYSVSIHIDIDTGEIITKENAKNNYIKIKTTKHANIQKNVGTITYTIEYKRNNQGKLFTLD